MSRNVSKARGIIPLNSSTDAPRRMQDGLRGGGRREAAPASVFTISVAFLKGYMQGHVTFRGLNKKKKIILLQ